jgi:hypothetical protein
MSLAGQQDKPAISFRARRWMIIASLIVLATVVFWFLSHPNSKPIPGNLPLQDQQEIAELLHDFTLAHGFRALRNRDVRLFIRTLFISRKQRVSVFADNRDGTYRVYTVVDDPEEPDGWYAWSRHYIQKTNGHWVIVRSY